MNILNNFKGIFIALTIILLWIVHLIFLLTQPLPAFYVIIPFITIQSFLYTGLFITAHDAMHGQVLPKNRKLNDLIGIIAVRLYAFFSYKNLLSKHWEHHKHPATQDDPDFHDDRHRGFFRWYLHFMANYLSWEQIIGMAIMFNVLHYLFHIPTINLILFWIVPAFASTFQLFYFGTFLPHRELDEGYKDHHRARSNNYSVFWSFLSCYHFGYHWEHHEYPYIPWWRLPAIRKKTLLAQNKKGR